jgi:hypothetical protein
MITNKQINAIYKLYPQVVSTTNNIAYDVNGNEVFYDLSLVTEKAQTDAQAEVAAKESALSKLTALGLTADEVKALLGIS